MMDFIRGLPKTYDKEVILVVIDMFTKYVYFRALSPPFTTLDVAQVFMDQVYNLHGFLKTNISNTDKIFLNNF